MAMTLLLSTPAGAADHPLLNKIWDVGAAQFLGEDELIIRLMGTRYVLLGETHDNAEHHRLQAQVLERLVRLDRRPVVAFEQMDTNQQPALDRYLGEHGRDLAGLPGLGDAVRWSDGWMAWRFYQPIAEVAQGAGLPIIAANLPDATLRTVMRDPAAVDADLAVRTRMHEPLPAAAALSLERELVAMHCGMTGPAMGPVIQQMAVGQRLRDSAFADALVRFDRGSGGVLIAGAGHTRTDRGVAWVLRQMQPDVTVAGVMFREVIDALTEPGDYARTLVDTPALPFDYVWFTGGGEGGRGEDPCR